MLVTMVIGDDVLAYARAAAHRDGVTLGAAMSLLVRQGIVAQQQPSVIPPVVLKSRLLPLRSQVHADALGTASAMRKSAGSRFS